MNALIPSYLGKPKAQRNWLARPAERFERSDLKVFLSGLNHTGAVGPRGRKLTERKIREVDESIRRSPRQDPGAAPDLPMRFIADARATTEPEPEPASYRGPNEPHRRALPTAGPL